MTYKIDLHESLKYQLFKEKYLVVYQHLPKTETKVGIMKLHTQVSVQASGNSEEGRAENSVTKELSFSSCLLD